MSRLSRFIHFYTDEDDGNGREEPFVLKTVTGTLLHITDALAKPAKKFVATLSPVQDLHGQDAPYPAGGGKNKFKPNVVLAAPYTNNGVTITYDETTGEFVFNGTCTNNFNFNLDNWDNNYISYTPASGNFYFTFSVYATNTPDGQNAFIQCGYFKDGSPTQNMAYFEGNRTYAISCDGTNVIYSRSYINITASVIYNNFRLKVQLELSDTATAWSPYSNECPITGHTGASVVRTGKNLLPVDNVSGTKSNVVYGNSNGLITANGTKSGGGYADFTSNKVFLKAGTYTAKTKLKEGSVTLNGSDCSFTAYLVRTEGAANIGDVTEAGSSKNITITEDVELYFRLAVWDDGVVFDNAVIEVSLFYGGDSTSDFEPYSGQTIPITFPAAAGTVYGCTLTLEDGGWKLRVDRAMIEYDGSSDEGWAYSSSYTLTNTACFYANSVPNAEYLSWYTAPVIVTNLFVTKSRDNIRYLDTPCVGFTGDVGVSSSPTVRCLKTTASTLEEFQSFLSNTPLMFCYKLATPTTYTLTETQALSLLKDTNNIWTDIPESELELTYYAKAE